MTRSPNNPYPELPECDGAWEGCEGCDSCIEEVTRTRVSVARTARSGVLPGDLIRVTTGFSYQSGGGPRLGYLSRVELLGHGPAHGPDLAGRGWPSSRPYADTHTVHAGLVAGREELTRRAHRATYKDFDCAAWLADVDAWEAAYGLTWWGTHPAYSRVRLTRESVVASYEHARERRITFERAEREAAWKRAELTAMRRATPGSTVSYRGRLGTVSKSWYRFVARSGLEYMGHLVDGDVHTYVTFTDAETGEGTRVRI